MWQAHGSEGKHIPVLVRCCFTGRHQKMPIHSSNAFISTMKVSISENCLLQDKGSSIPPWKALFRSLTTSLHKMHENLAHSFIFSIVGDVVFQVSVKWLNINEGHHAKRLHCKLYKSIKQDFNTLTIKTYLITALIRATGFFPGRFALTRNLPCWGE